MSANEELLRWDAEHIVHSLYPIGRNRELMIERAEGVTLEDHQGKKYLDFSSQLDCVNLGYGRSELVAVAEKAMRETSFLTTFFGLSNRASIECAKALCELTPPGLDHFFFSAGGSESNEAAFMMARRYWQSVGRPTKHKIISQYGCYHGATFAARSCTNMGRGSLDMGLMQTLPGFLHAPHFHCYRCMLGLRYPECGVKCVDFIADMIEREGRDNVAAFIAEPVIGAPGMVPPPPEYWPKLRAVCTAHDVLLIADEVMTGFYRTGKAFACEHWNVTPDLMTMAKGITSAYFPVGVLAFNERVYEGMKGQVEEGHTYSGHPVGMAIAVKAMEIYRQEKIGEHVIALGMHLLDRLREEVLPLPHVGDVSGLGFMGGIEIVADKETRQPFERSLGVVGRIKAQALNRGLFMRSAVIEEGMGDRVVWSPPLTMTREELDRAVDILKGILTELEPAV